MRVGYLVSSSEPECGMKRLPKFERDLLTITQHLRVSEMSQVGEQFASGEGDAAKSGEKWYQGGFKPVGVFVEVEGIPCLSLHSADAVLM